MTDTIVLPPISDTTVTVGIGPSVDITVGPGNVVEATIVTGTTTDVVVNPANTSSVVVEIFGTSTVYGHAHSNKNILDLIDQSVAVASSPTFAKLTINAGSEVVGLDLAASNSYVEMRVIRNSASPIDQDMFIGYNSGLTSSLHLYSNNAETLTVKGQKVGINQASPRGTLDVYNGRIVTDIGLNIGFQFGATDSTGKLLRFSTTTADTLVMDSVSAEASPATCKNFTFGSLGSIGNFGLFASSFGTGAGKILGLGYCYDRPYSSPADMVQLWVENYNDTAELATLHLRNEDGTVIKFNQALDTASSPRFANLLIGTTTDDASNKLQVAGSIIANDATSKISNLKAMMTPEGGFAIKVAAGEALVKGNIVSIRQANGADGKVWKSGNTDTPDDMPVGIVYANASADADVWIVKSGIAEVLPLSTVTATRGYLLIVGAEDGRADQSSVAPVDSHWKECGHFLDTGSGAGVLTRAIIHFN